LRARATVTVLLLMLAVAGVLSSRPQVNAEIRESRRVPFPLRDDDSWNLGNHYPYWIVSGDSVTGTRPIDITEINTVTICLNVTYNSVQSIPHIFEVSLNNNPVGEFYVYGGLGLKTEIISFNPINTNGYVVIQYKLKSCAALSGIVMEDTGSSNVTLSDGYPPTTKREFTLKALDKLNKLRASVDLSDIDKGPKHSLLNKLDRAISKVDQALFYIEKGNEEKANNRLRIALRAVDDFSERVAPYSEAWRSDAEEIMMLIETAIQTPI